MLVPPHLFSSAIFFFQAEDGIRDLYVTGVQTCALPIWRNSIAQSWSSALRRGWVCQRGLGAVRSQLVLGASYQVLPFPGRQFAVVGHANRPVSLGAQAAENALAQIQCRRAGILALKARNRAGW